MTNQHMRRLSPVLAVVALLLVAGVHDRSRPVVNADLGDIYGVAHYDHPDRDSDGPVDYGCPFDGHGNGDVLASDGRWTVLVLAGERGSRPIRTMSAGLTTRSNPENSHP